MKANCAENASNSQKSVSKSNSRVISNPNFSQFDQAKKISKELYKFFLIRKGFQPMKYNHLYRHLDPVTKFITSNQENTPGKMSEVHSDQMNTEKEQKY